MPDSADVPDVEAIDEDTDVRDSVVHALMRYTRPDDDLEDKEVGISGFPEFLYGCLQNVAAALPQRRPMSLIVDFSGRRGLAQLKHHCTAHTIIEPCRLTVQNRAPALLAPVSRYAFTVRDNGGDTQRRFFTVGAELKKDIGTYAEQLGLGPGGASVVWLLSIMATVVEVSSRVVHADLRRFMDADLARFSTEQRARAELFLALRAEAVTLPVSEDFSPTWGKR